MSKSNYQELVKPIISLSIDAVEKAKSGHPGAPMGMSDFVTVLFVKYLRFSAKHPNWLERDRFILSNGHASMLLYSLMYLTGYEKPTLDDIKNFRQVGYVTTGHPEYEYLRGVEVTTGPLGQGFANAVGMAIAQKKSNHLNSRVFVTIGDGCLMEGISHEAGSLAGHLGLNNLIALFDSNRISIDGSTDLSDSTNTKKRFESYGWNVLEADGHNYDEIEQALESASTFKNKPTIIIFHTIIGRQANKKRDSETSHGAPLGTEEVKFVKEAIGYQNYEPFQIPENILEEWRDIGSRYDSEAEQGCIDRRFELSSEASSKINDLITFEYMRGSDENEKSIGSGYEVLAMAHSESTRKSSGVFLEKITPYIPEILGGSADLSESNCTKTKNSQVITKDDFSGNFIHYGIREHVMTAIVNGIACYGNGFLPFGSSFLVFSDYAKPSIRLAAIMGIQTIQIYTHDSIGLGEDGPTHQPIEQLAGLRAIPNLLVFRPADAFEMCWSWKIALMKPNQPSIIVCSRQNLKQLPKNFSQEKIESEIEKGAWIVSDYNTDLIKEEAKKILILSTGSEVSFGLELANKIESEKQIPVRLISIVCTNLFEENEDFMNEILDYSANLIVAIEAGTRVGWDRYLRKGDLFIGMDNKFGASGKGEDLYKYFGITVEEIFKKLDF